jgi:hypothetical protein
VNFYIIGRGRGYSLGWLSHQPSRERARTAAVSRYAAALQDRGLADELRGQWH